MKKARIYFSFLLAALFLPVAASAMPVISSLNMSESDLWLGEGAQLFLDCADDSNMSIAQVYASVSGPGIILPDMNFSAQESSYSLSIPPSYLDRSGTFDAAVYCINNLSEINSSTISFSVSNLTSGVAYISTPAYIGDVAELGFVVKKDGVPLSSGVSFSISVDGQPVSLYQGLPPAYTSDKGWILKLSTSSLGAGNHSVGISAGYGRVSVSGSAVIEMRNPVEFAVTNVDRTEVQSGNEIIVSIRAKERGNPIVVTGAHVSAQVDSASASVSGISGSGGNYDVRIVAPEFSSGTRQLKLAFNYGNFSSVYTKSIVYVVPVSGKLIGADNKGLSVQFTFKSGSGEKKASSDASGAYSTYLAPGTYNITMVHDSSTLEIDRAAISSFEDPLKYMVLPNLDVPGIKEAGVFVYEAALEYSGAYVRMKYDEGKVADESKLKVYECDSWNSGRRECVSGWSEISSSIDTIRNQARIYVSTLHAYAIGTDDSVSADASLDKESYFVNETVKLSGIVRDSVGSGISGANITASVEGRTYRAVTLSGGAYAMSMDAPLAEGKYVLVVKAEKPPYVAFSKNVEFSVTKSRGASIVAPDIVRVRPGESASAEFKIVNTGQADLYNVKISLDDVPGNYYLISTPEISVLKSGEQKQVSVTFTIPQDAAKATLGGSFILSGGIEAKQSFGLTISSQQQAEDPKNSTLSSPVDTGQEESSAGFGFPTAFIAAYQPSSDAVSLIALAVLSISSALVLRRRRVSAQQNPWHSQSQNAGRSYGSNPTKTLTRNVLFDIKKSVVEPARRKDKKLQSGTPAGKRQAKGRKRKPAAGMVRYAKRW